MRASLFAVVVLATTLLGIPVAHAEDDGPGFWHLDLDVAYGPSDVSFVGPEDVLPAACSVVVCDGNDFEVDLMRGTLGIGHGGFTVEASMAMPADGSSGAHPYLTWSAGVRIDTSYLATLSMFFRFAYVNRWGDLEGEGGRAGTGIQLRLWWLTAYAEASVDITGVPSAMSDNGTVFSYATLLAGGIRLRFGA